MNIMNKQKAINIMPHSTISLIGNFEKSLGLFSSLGLTLKSAQQLLQILSFWLGWLHFGQITIPPPYP
jgi:hypothetical protein